MSIEGFYENYTVFCTETEFEKYSGKNSWIPKIIIRTEQHIGRGTNALKTKSDIDAYNK